MVEIVKSLEEPKVLELKDFKFKADKLYGAVSGESLYLLHYLGNDSWGFINLTNSDTRRCTRSSVIGAVESFFEFGGRMYMFDNLAEFLTWAKENFACGK